MNHRQRVSLILALLCFAVAVIIFAAVANSQTPTPEQQVRAYYHVLTLDYNPQQPPETRYAVYVGDVEHGRLIGQGASPAEAWEAAAERK